MKRSLSLALALVLAPLIASALPVAHAGESSLLNVSYDPTREFYQDVNTAFAAAWSAKTGVKPTVRQSHGGSGKQARSVIDGLEADVVTLALGYDIDAIAASGMIAPEWQKRLPNNSCPYTSTIVFLVRKGNPKAIRDWGDLAKPGIAVVTPNPKTSGGARWNYLAAWAWALRQPGGSDTTARALLLRLFANVPILDTGARGSTITFVERGQGDVLIAWENEALHVTRKMKPGAFEIVYPSVSMRAEPPVAWVDKTVARRGTEALARAYLEFLYQPQGQELAAKHFYRPHDAAIAGRSEALFPTLEQVGIDAFGGWASAHRKHFAEGAVFDQIMTKR
ncbi:MAG: sulfate ABC transporter substrate-binding protein [Acidobacteria bacterium]|nr:sulfate ABC transporter substrate-binding protein [Acidobacteriota bacterium]